MKTAYTDLSEDNSGNRIGSEQCRTAVFCLAVLFLLGLPLASGFWCGAQLVTPQTAWSESGRVRTVIQCDFDNVVLNVVSRQESKAESTTRFDISRLLSRLFWKQNGQHRPVSQSVQFFSPAACLAPLLTAAWRTKNCFFGVWRTPFHFQTVLRHALPVRAGPPA